jgi:plastocyanin
MRISRASLALAGAALLLPGSALAATYKVSAGAPPTAKMPLSFSVGGLYDADAFYPGSHRTLKIHKGDKVQFSGGFHTATILGSAPRGPLEFIQPDPAHGTYAAVNDQSTPTPLPFYWAGLPKFVYNGATLSPIGSTTVNSRTATYSSGVLAGPKPYTLKFNKTGTYKLVCLLHPGMTGNIQVLARSKKVTSVGRVAKRARAEVQTDVRAAERIDLNKPRVDFDPANAVVTVGAGSKRTSLFAFYPSALSVKVGTTVTFRSGSINEPHNVGIGDINYQFSLLPLVDLFPEGPTGPNQVNPFLFYGSDAPDAQGVRTFAGAASHGNGFLATNVVWRGSLIPGIAKETKVKFTAPGTFTYICQIHPNMVGTVHVHPAAP